MFNYFEFATIFLICGIIISFITFLSPYWGLFFIVMLFPFMVGWSEGVDIVEQAFVVLFAIWIIGWLLRLLSSQRTRWEFRWHPLFKPTVAVGGVLIIGVFAGLINGAHPTDVFRDLSQYIGYLLILPVASIIKRKKEALKLLTLLAIIGLPCYVWSSFVWWARKFNIEYGAMNAVSIGRAYFGPFIGTLWPLILLKTKKRIRILALILLSLLIIYTLGSGYRSSIILVIIMTLTSIWLIWSIQSGNKKLKVVIPFFIGILFAVWVYYGTLGYLSLPGGERTRQLYSSLVFPSALSEDLSFQGRMEEAKAALETFKKYPLFGIGLGHHVEMYWRYGRWYETAYTQHIWVAEMLMKFGIFGSVLFLFYFISILKFTYKIAKNINIQNLRVFSMGVFIWMFTLLIPVMGSFSDRGFAFTVALVSGLLPSLSAANFIINKNDKQ